jgi:hypothetical protein
MDMTRTQLAVIVLFAAAIIILVPTTLRIIDPQAAGGPATGGPPGLSPTLIAVACLSLLGVLGMLVGVGTLLADARNYSQGHLVACIVALVLIILGIGMPIVAAGGGAYARSGDVDAYHRTLDISSIGTVLGVLAMVVAPWFLFKPGWRVLPVVVGIVRAAAGIGELQATRLHSTLAEQTFGDQTVYLPHFDVPLTSGPIYTWRIVGWAGTVLLAGMWAMLLFAADDAMVPRPEKKPGVAAEAPVED